MKADNFCLWLRGFVELRDNSAPPTAEQWLEIQRKLKTVADVQDAPVIPPRPNGPTVYGPPPVRYLSSNGLGPVLPPDCPNYTS